MALIAFDTLVNALCACIALRLMGRRIRPGRALASALLGAALAALLRCGGISGLYRALLWLPAAYLMAGAAGCGWRVRGALVLLGAYGLLGGTVAALAGAAGSLAAGWLAGAAALGPMALAMLRARRVSLDVHRVRVIIRMRGQEAAFDAIIDSGNSLRDYLTHRPVIVLPGAAADALGLRGAPLRPIFADTAGGRQMMGCFTPERVMLRCGGRLLCASACAAISGALADGAPALVPQALLDREWNGEDMRAYGADKEGDAYGETEGRAQAGLGLAHGAANAGHHPAGGIGCVYRRQRFAARAADTRGRDGAVHAHGGGRGGRAQDAHRAQPETGGLHRQKV